MNLPFLIYAGMISIVSLILTIVGGCCTWIKAAQCDKEMSMYVFGAGVSLGSVLLVLLFITLICLPCKSRQAIGITFALLLGMMWITFGYVGAYYIDMPVEIYITVVIGVIFASLIVGPVICFLFPERDEESEEESDYSDESDSHTINEN